jgi:hypothetical protein
MELKHWHISRWTLIDWLWWGENMSQNCGHQQSYYSSPRWYMWVRRAMVVMMMPAGNNSWLVYQSSLAILPAEMSGASRRNGQRSENFAFSVSEIPQGIFNMPWNLMTWDLQLYFPSEGRCAADFYCPWKSIASARFEPATLGSSGKHTNHYTTEATKADIVKWRVLWHSVGRWLAKTQDGIVQYEKTWQKQR